MIYLEGGGWRLIRAFNADGERLSILDERYHKGWMQPNYPVPATIGMVDIDCMGVFVYEADENRPNPLTSYWRGGPVDYMEPCN